MSYKLPIEIIQDIEFIKRARKIPFSCNSEIKKCINTNHESINSLINSNNEVLLYLPHEFITDKTLYDNLISDIESHGVSYKIMSSTSSYFKNYIHPIASLFGWNGVKIDLDINWKHDGTDIKVPTFSYDNYKPCEKVNEDRKYRGILSIRKSNTNRDVLFDEYSLDIKDGISRYAKLPHHHLVTKSDSERVKEFPTWSELQKEYKQSYFSFVIETRDNSKNNNETLDTSFTEKTLLGLMSGTMPIVLGYKGFVKSLEDIGIKVWNNEFGFDNADEKEDYDVNGFYYFHKCIENINKLSMDEVKDYWKQNQDIIQNNYNLVSSVVSDRKYKFTQIITNESSI